jgi:hypothetical protein
MSWIWVLKQGGMSGYGKLYILIICSSQILALKIHSIFNLRNKITGKFVVILISIFLHEENLHHLMLL